MSSISELTDDNFATTMESESTPVLLQFSATWCQPCKLLTPTIEAVQEQYEGKLNVYKIDIEQAQDVVSEYDVRGVPSCVFLKTGKEVDRFFGNLDLRSVKDRVEKVLA